MVNLIPPRSPRSVAQETPMSPEALDPASPSRDINAIVEAAAKRFEEMDEELKSLMQDMKNYQAAMQDVSENRLKTARHLESFATNAPFADYVGPPLPPMMAVVGTEASIDSQEPAVGTDSVASDEATGEEAKEASIAKDEPEITIEESEDKKLERTTEAEENTRDETTVTEEEIMEQVAAIEEACAEASDAKPKADDAKPKAEDAEPKAEDAEPKAEDAKSFAGVHQSVYKLSKSYGEQYGTYLIKYLESWERTVSQRVQGLLIHYRELQDNMTHYNKKVGGLLQKVDRKKSVGQRLSERLDRNEIKEMGAVEARDTVGEHLYLYIEEVMERAWRDVFPLLLRACRFEAQYSVAQANMLSGLVTVAERIQKIGEEEDCNVMGRLDELEKKHPEEIFTENNPFVTLTPRKKKGKQPELSGAGSQEEDLSTGEEHETDASIQSLPAKVEL